MTDSSWKNDNTARYGDKAYMDEAMQAFGDSLDEAFDVGYDIGFKVGYQKAVEESYPELNHA